MIVVYTRDTITKHYCNSVVASATVNPLRVTNVKFLLVVALLDQTKVVRKKEVIVSIV